MVRGWPAQTGAGLCSRTGAPETHTETFEALLFDDVMWVDQAKRDHFDFVSKMRDRGVEVLEFVTMLGEVLDDPVARAWVLDRKVTDGMVGRGVTPKSAPGATPCPPTNWRGS